MAKLWIQGDKFGNDIYLTAERWQHIIDQDNHPEVEPFFDYLRQTIKFGRRRQDRYNPNGYQYYRTYPDLPAYNTHLIVCVLFRWPINPDGTIGEEKFVTTAYFQVF